MMSSRNENSVTTAIVAAGSHFCRGNGLKWPVFSALAANQQGAGLNKLCGDVLVALGDYKIGLFETKELVGNKLVEFKEDQHLDCLKYQKLGVPIQYAYGIQRLQSQLTEDDPESPRKVLEQIKRSPPCELKGMVPMAGHKDLASWFLAIGKSDGGEPLGELTLTPWEALGCIHGTMRSWSENFRNSALILLYSTEANAFKKLTLDELKLFVDLLSGQRQSLSQRALILLDSLLKKSAEIQAAYASLRNHPPSPAVTADDEDLSKAGDDTGQSLDDDSSEGAKPFVIRPKGPG